MEAAVASRFQIVRQAETTLGEIELSCTTHADKNRCAKVRRAMVALDEEQMSAKSAVANLIDSLDVGYSVPEVIEDLRDLVKRWDRESRAAAKTTPRVGLGVDRLLGGLAGGGSGK
jgi:hypothetical protein